MTNNSEPTVQDADQIQLLSKPEVTLEDSMGNDLAVVNAARVSFAKRSKYEWVDRGIDGREVTVQRLKDADRGLISYLMKNRHGTPFEMVQFRFRIAAPIRVMREWQRHRVGSFNETSTRYVEMKPKFFVSGDDAVRVQTGKPGHYVMEPADVGLSATTQLMMTSAYDAAWEKYQALLRLGVAKELAAYVLPLGLYSEMIWSVNLRSLFNFLSLRTAPNALREIRDAAEEVERLARDVVPVCFEVFDEHGRVQP